MTSHPHPPHDAAAPPWQPLLNDAVVAFRAPTQVWSNRDGDLGGGAIDGVYHGDIRHVRVLELSCAQSPVEWISSSIDGATRVVFDGLLRGLDDRLPDPKVRLRRDRHVSDGALTETYTVASRLDHAIETTLVLRVIADFASLHDVKAGTAQNRPMTARTSLSRLEVDGGAQSFAIDAPDADIASDGDIHTLTWSLSVAPGGSAEVSWTLAMQDPSLVVRAASPGPGIAHLRDGATAADVDHRLWRWLDVASDDLDALRLTLPGHPDDPFYAAGAPWFLTLFGRDSVWAARLTQRLDPHMAASTLRVLARLQATRDEAATAQEPGKILHELRASALEIPSEGVVLPPLYYGSVDSTPLWVCLLADAWRGGMSETDVRELLPALRAALGWIVEHGDSDGDGFLDYIDRTGQGLANQGWKDSGDSIQWRNGTLADGPIALCEVQGYAYEAALAGADMLAALGDASDAPTAATLREWAAALKHRFAEAFWIDTPEGRYPAVALDRDKRPVDTLTSNIGHLLGTGILEPDQEREVAALLTGPTMLSGYGIRTMSTASAGYWPLSYHGGSVWLHDTAIIARGMHRAGLRESARTVVDGMLTAAEGFAYRVPELHSGDARDNVRNPLPYPAACRPQAWSAAAALTAFEILTARQVE